MIFGALGRFVARLFGAGKASSHVVSSAPVRPVSPAPSPVAVSEPQQTVPEQTRDHALADGLLRSSNDLFYEVMFRHSGDNNQGGELEQRILQLLRDDLQDVGSIASDVVHLPSLILQIDQELKRPDYDASRITRLIEQEPVIAANVLKLANSPAFKPFGSEINNIQQAIAYIGGRQLHQLVITAALQQISDTPKIYFKFFGQQIWQHSLQTAEFGRQLAKHQGLDPYTAYFTGLVHDIGKIAIFRILVSALRDAHPDHKPSSQLFKKALTKHSLTLSWQICRDWGLPHDIADALQQQTSGSAPSTGLAKLIFQANLYSELAMVHEAKLSSADDLLAVAEARGLSAEQLQAWLDSKSA